MGSVTKFLQEEKPDILTDPKVHDWVIPVLCMMFLLKDLDISLDALESTAAQLQYRAYKPFFSSEGNNGQG